MEAVRHPDRYHVYVWEFPVRLFHWANALCIVLLGVTGYLIGNPPALHSGTEASQQYWFGTVRFVHFATAWVWICTSMIRVYWGFVGNEYVRFRHFLPLTREQWREIVTVLRMDILQTYKGATVSVGHNALAGVVYTIGFLAFLFMTVTGLGMYSAMSKAWFAGLFSWVIPLMGSDHAVRIWHHAGLWGFFLFMIGHVYLSAYHDYVEATGTMSSMVGGWKFLRQPRSDGRQARGSRRH